MEPLSDERSESVQLAASGHLLDHGQARTGCSLGLLDCGMPEAGCFASWNLAKTPQCFLSFEKATKRGVHVPCIFVKYLYF